MTTLESRDDCPPVEAFLWDCLSFDYGREFSGIEQLSLDQVRALRRLCDRQIHAMTRDTPENEE
jgi:hypothetical protein